MVLFFSTIIQAQSQYKGKINMYDDKGEKIGLWKNTTEKYYIETYYLGGVKSGVYKLYSSDKEHLLVFGEYKENQMTGTWYLFHQPSGRLMWSFEKFKKNNVPIPAVHNTQTVCAYQCYSVRYYPDGVKESEGLVLCNDNLLDDFYECGEWKYYSETGELIGTRQFN